jgi:predicted DNA-binding antitoxin AbrB/MazE fold protein
MSAMTTTIEAVYENGILRPKKPLGLVEGAEVQLIISALDEDHDPLDEVVGICTEGPDMSLAERHDEILYGGKPCKETNQP